MLIRAGYRIRLDVAQPTPCLLLLSLHPGRLDDLRSPHAMLFEPAVAARDYVDLFGNTVTRIVAPPGPITVALDVTVEDDGMPDRDASGAAPVAVEALPHETLVYLLGSRYCETDRMSPLAWSLFGHLPPGHARVQAICGYVHDRVRFDYSQARPTRSAWETHEERVGVCRDYAHLAVTLCRCMNIPARYCSGFLGDIGVPEAPYPMDFSAWFEAWLEGGWYVFDARHNRPRIGRIVMARGRDATDVALVTNFGPAVLAGFEVHTFEVG